jgi:hypothetical protein
MPLRSRRLNFADAMLHRRLFTGSLLAVCLDAQAQSAALLTVGGPRLGDSARGRRVTFDRAALAALPQRKLAAHTPWFDGARVFTGPLLRHVIDAAGAPADFAGTLRCTALNDYRVDVPVADAQRYDVVVAHSRDGRPMTVRDKGPLFVIYPFDEHPGLRTSTYYSRCIWQLKAIELV